MSSEFPIATKARCRRQHKWRANRGRSWQDCSIGDTGLFSCPRLHTVIFISLYKPRLAHPFYFIEHTLSQHELSLNIPLSHAHTHTLFPPPGFPLFLPPPFPARWMILGPSTTSPTTPTSPPTPPRQTGTAPHSNPQSYSELNYRQSSTHSNLPIKLPVKFFHKYLLKVSLNYALAAFYSTENSSFLNGTPRVPSYRYKYMVLECIVFLVFLVINK